MEIYYFLFLFVFLLNFTYVVTEDNEKNAKYSEILNREFVFLKILKNSI